MYYRKHIESKQIRKAKKAVIVLLIVLAILSGELALRPAVRSVAENRAQAQFGLSVSSAALDVLSSGSLTEVSMGEDGEVSYVSVNSAAASAAAALITQNVENQLDDEIELPVPMGSLTGITALSGLGPDLTMRVQLLGAVETELETQFEDAGINQTLHRVVCVVSADALVLLAGQSVRLRLTSTVAIAETVIVGKTPESYTSVNGDKSDTIGQIFDYGDPYGEDVLE